MDTDEHGFSTSKRNLPNHPIDETGNVEKFFVISVYPRLSVVLYSLIFYYCVILKKPRATLGKPLATLGKPRATLGKPRVTLGKPRATLGKPRAVLSLTGFSGYAPPDAKISLAPSPPT